MGEITTSKTDAQAKYNIYMEETTTNETNAQATYQKYMREATTNEQSHILKPQHPKTQTRKQHTTNMRHGNKRASNSYERDENNTIKKKKHTWGK